MKYVLVILLLNSYIPVSTVNEPDEVTCQQARRTLVAGSELRASAIVCIPRD